MVCCFKKISGPCQGPLGVFGDLSLRGWSHTLDLPRVRRRGDANAARLCALQGRDTRFDRRMRAKPLSDTTGNAKGGDALGKLARRHAA